MSTSNALLLLVVSMFASAFFSGMEAGVLAMSRIRLQQYLRAGKKSAKPLLAYLDRPEEFLWTTLVGGILFGVLSFTAAIVLLNEGLGQGSPWPLIVFPVFVGLYYLLCELTPKLLFQRFPNRLCIRFYRPFQILSWGLTLLVRGVSAMAKALTRRSDRLSFFTELFNHRNKVRLMLRDAAPALTKEEGAIIDRALSLAEITARERALRIQDIHVIGVEENIGHALQICRETGLNRLPAIDPRQKNPRVVGIFELDRVLYQPNHKLNAPIREILRRPLRVDARASLQETLQQMRDTNCRLAVVSENQEKDIGIVSINDILRIIFGDVHPAPQEPLSKL